MQIKCIFYNAVKLTNLYSNKFVKQQLWTRLRILSTALTVALIFFKSFKIYERWILDQLFKFDVFKEIVLLKFIEIHMIIYYSIKFMGLQQAAGQCEWIWFYTNMSKSFGILQI